MSMLSQRLLMSKARKLPIIQQAQFSECGHACIAMISNFHGYQLDLASLRALEEPAINGSSMLDLVRLFERLNFTTRAIRIELDELKQVQCPAILHWNLNHFVVLKSVHKNYVILHDPAIGERKLSFGEVSQAFTGVALEIEKKEQFAIIRSQKTLALIDLFKRIEGLKNSFLVLLFLSIGIELFMLINPLFIQYITDGVTSSNSINNLYVIVTGFLILTVCHTFIEYMRSHFVVYLTNRMTEYFSSGVMAHLLNLPYSYFERRHKGDILSRFYSINEIQTKITTDSINSLLDGFVIILALVIMLIYSFKLTLVVVLALIFYTSIRILAYGEHKKQTELSINEHAQVNSKFLEIIQSIMPIKLYTKESTMFQRWKNHFITAMNADIKISIANVRYNLANLLVFNIENIMVITIGALLVVHNQFSVGMLMAFLAYRQSLVNKSSSLVQKIFDYKLISVQLNRVADILLEPPEREDKTTHSKKIIHGDLKIQNLSYRYAENQNWILKEVSFHIREGEKVAITGPSGAGKTTLLKIMLGLIQPSEGEILLDDIHLSALGIKEYRSGCAAVMQDDVLISGSILDNITFMNSEVDIERVYKVSKMAQIHDDIIQMPMNYETLIGDLGSSLSGGQKQRILIARALYKNPRILFLDEATSHLDVETEIKINNMLKELKITQIIIAHREESIKMADRIIIINKQ